MPAPHALDITAQTHTLAGGLPAREHRWMLIAEVGEPGQPSQHPEIQILRELVGQDTAPVWRQLAEDNELEFAAITYPPAGGLTMRLSIAEHQHIRQTLSRFPIVSLSINGGIPFIIRVEVDHD